MALETATELVEEMLRIYHLSGAVYLPRSRLLRSSLILCKLGCSHLGSEEGSAPLNSSERDALNDDMVSIFGVSKM